MATLLLFGLCNPAAYASTIIDAEAQANLYAIRSTASAEAYNMLSDEIFDGNMYVPDYAGGTATIRTYAAPVDRRIFLMFFLHLCAVYAMIMVALHSLICMA